MTSVRSREERLRAEVEEMKKNFKQLDSAHQEKITEFTRRILETQKKLNQRENEVKLVADELARYERATDDLNDQLTEHRRAADQELTSTNARNEQLEQEVESMTDEINDLKMALENQSDAKKWKSLYEDLRDQVRPFQSQLDAYSAERAMLLSETSAAHAESTRLGIKYAELLGHQNQKQKIKHIVKIKEESAALKQENMKLRNQNALLTKQVVNARQPTFDPSKAFQHHKENANPN
uniref:Hyaluronan-mediated motility receptor C-terminal domain-containing protein n=1 Tax=Ciona savignyi TaxID=51511 RepID=H2ZI24_CIOSA